MIVFSMQKCIFQHSTKIFLTGLIEPIQTIVMIWRIQKK